MLQVEFAERSDRGPVRRRNEDFCGVHVPRTASEIRARGWLFALADGVGGQAGGNLASRLAVETLLSGFAQLPDGEALKTAIPRLIQTANQRVFEAPGTGATAGSMATTIVSCALRHDRAVVAHLGDSRCYLIRRAQVAALTQDHTVAKQQARLGLLVGKQAVIEESANVLSQCLGTEMFVHPDVSEHLLLEEDVLVLCTDGLHHSISGQETAEVIRKVSDVNRAADELIDLANRRDGGDNVTVQIIRVKSVERVGIYRGRPYKLR